MPQRNRVGAVLSLIVLVAVLVGCGAQAPGGGDVQVDPAFSLLQPVPPGVDTAQIQLVPRPDKQGPIPADMPPGTPTLALPLYPHAVAAPDRNALPDQLPGSSYLKLGVAVYRLPTDPAKAMAWYRLQMAAVGCQEAGTSSSGQWGTVTAQGITFRTPDHPDLWIELSFRPGGASGQTLLVYGVGYVETPARPADSILPAAITRVDIDYAPGQQAAHIRRTLNDPQAIAPLADAVNRLARDTRGVTHCLADHGEAADVRFVGQDGRTWHMHVRPACAAVLVGTTSLYDPGLRVWNAVGAAVGK